MVAAAVPGHPHIIGAAVAHRRDFIFVEEHTGVSVRLDHETDSAINAAAVVPITAAADGHQMRLLLL